MSAVAKLYMKLTSNTQGLIEGESVTVHFVRQIEIDDWSWSVETPSGEASSDASAPSIFGFSKLMDRSTTNLLTAMRSGELLDAEISLQEMSRDTFELKVMLSEIRVIDYAVSRTVADRLATHVAGIGFSTSLAMISVIEYPNDNASPWYISGAGDLSSASRVLDGRMPRMVPVPVSANPLELVGRIGERLKALWDDPTTNVRARAERHGEAGGVAACSMGVHQFSLTPGEPVLSRLLADPRDFEVALREHVDEERRRWQRAQDDTVLRTRHDLAEQMRLLLGATIPDDMIDMLWHVCGDSLTMRQFFMRMTGFFPGFDAAGMNALLNTHAMLHLKPPVPAAELDRKLEKVARALDVPADAVADVGARARRALRLIDPRQASMTDIKAAMVDAMRAEGLDAAGVTQSRVSAALQEPIGLIFADSNWGDAEHRIKFALIVNPLTGEPQACQMHEDGSHPAPLDGASYIHNEWILMT